MTFYSLLSMPFKATTVGVGPDAKMPFIPLFAELSIIAFKKNATDAGYPFHVPNILIHPKIAAATELPKYLKKKGPLIEAPGFYFIFY